MSLFLPSWEFYIAIFVIGLIFNGISSTTTESDLKTVNTAEILPNASGVRKILSKDSPVILQIAIKGIIGTDSLNAQTIRQKLIESREKDFKNDRVKGILLYINSPGGTVFDSDSIYQELKAYKEK